MLSLISASDKLIDLSSNDMPNSVSDSYSWYHITIVRHRTRKAVNRSLEVFKIKIDRKKYLNQGIGSYQWPDASDLVDR